MSFNMFMSGVGGQGLVLITSIIGNACVRSGKKAVTGEMHGLSQRSGTVSIHMRIGENVFSPLIPYGKADILVSLEATEALRYIEYLKKGGTILMNSRIMHPPVETARVLREKDTKYITVEEIAAMDTKHCPNRLVKARKRQRKREHGEHGFPRSPVDA
jgi:indolepyruvate ferredoxin oxidoreductase beta subunit